MVKAARFAREKGIPYLGLCLGLHVMVIELARYAFQNGKANSAEFDPDTPYPVIDLLPEQKELEQKGGTMRLGTHPCRLTEGTKAFCAYQQEMIHERHRHRYEFNNLFREPLEKAGLVLSGLSPDGRLVEIVENKSHPWMVSCQFHPEFKSRLDHPHPLFVSFIEAAQKTLVDGAQLEMKEE